MATVYLAEDLKHDRKVAIKVLKPELAAVLGAERFVQEIKTTAALSHPHILPLFDSGEAAGFLYYVMPWRTGDGCCRGGDHDATDAVTAAAPPGSESARLVRVSRSGTKDERPPRAGTYAASVVRTGNHAGHLEVALMGLAVDEPAATPATRHGSEPTNATGEAERPEVERAVEVLREGPARTEFIAIGGRDHGVSLHQEGSARKDALIEDHDDPGEAEMCPVSRAGIAVMADGKGIHARQHLCVTRGAEVHAQPHGHHIGAADALGRDGTLECRVNPFTRFGGTGARCHGDQDREC